MKKITLAREAVKPMKAKQFKAKVFQNENDESKINSFEDTADRLRKDLSGNADVIMRELFVGGNENIDALLIYLNGNTDKKMLSDNIIRPVMNCKGLEDITRSSEKLKEHLVKKCLQTGSVNFEKDYKIAVQNIFEGKGVLLVKGIEGFLTFTVEGGTGKADI